MSKAKVNLLENEDIFDLYGCEFVHSHPSVSKDDKNTVELRIDEIYGKYLYASRERIKSECRFLGISPDDYEGASFSMIFKMFDKIIEKEMDEQAENLMQGGGFNLMKGLVNAHRAAGQDLSGLDVSKFGVDEAEETEKKNSINTESLIKDPKWHIIAEAFIDLENAETIKEKIQTIDYLNDLQHNSFHLLVDLQTGRMLEGQSEGGGYGNHHAAVENVQRVLDIKHDASSPKEYSNKMSKEIAKLVNSYERL